MKVQSIILQYLLLTSIFLSINGKKILRRSPHLQSESLQKKKGEKLSLGKKKAMLLSKTKANTKFAPPLLPLMVINSGLSLIITIVNIGIKHQEQLLKNFNDRQIKELFDFKGKSDTVKRGTCISIMEVNSVFIDLFDWLTIESLYLKFKQYEIIQQKYGYDSGKAQIERLFENVLQQQLVEMNDEGLDRNNNPVLANCSTENCIKIVLKISSINTLIDGLRKTKLQMLSFQDQFCDFSRDLIGEEVYFDARTNGLLETMYPTPVTSNTKKTLLQVWGGFNDVLGVFEEVVWVEEAAWESYTACNDSIQKALKEGTAENNPAVDQAQKYMDNFWSNNLISEVRNQYLNAIFDHQIPTDPAKLSGFYWRHIITGNPVYQGLGGLNSLYKRVKFNFKTLFAFTSKIGITDRAIAFFSLLQDLQPFIIFVIFCIYFGFIGASKLVNTLFSVFVFNSLLAAFLTFGVAYFERKKCEEALADPNLPQGGIGEFTKMKLNEALKDANDKENGAVKSIIWNLILLISPFIFFAGMKWAMKKLLKYGMDAVTSLINGLLFGIIIFKLIKNIVTLILAIKKYYALRSKLKQKEEEIMIERPLRDNYIGNLTVQLIYVFIKFNLCIYDGLNNFLSIFSTLEESQTTIPDNSLAKMKTDPKSFGRQITRDLDKQDQSGQKSGKTHGDGDQSQSKGKKDTLKDHNWKLTEEIHAKNLDEEDDEVPEPEDDNETMDSDAEENKRLKEIWNGDKIVQNILKTNQEAKSKTKSILPFYLSLELAKLATQNTRLFYKYKAHIINRFFDQKAIPAQYTLWYNAFKEFLENLYFASPITKPMMFKLASFEDNPDFIKNSGLFVNRHESFPSDYVCLFRKSFFSNTYLKNVHYFKFNLKDKTYKEDYLQKFKALKNDIDLFDPYFMESETVPGEVHVIVFVSSQIFNAIDIQNFKIFKSVRSDQNQVFFQFNNDILDTKYLSNEEKSEIMAIINFSPNLYKSEDKTKSDDSLALNLSTFNYLFGYSSNEHFSKKTFFINPFDSSIQTCPSKKDKEITLTYYHVSCLQEKKKINGFFKILICPQKTVPLQQPDGKNTNLMFLSITTMTDKIEQECSKDFIKAEYIVEIDDLSKNLIDDIKAQKIKEEENMILDNGDETGVVKSDSHQKKVQKEVEKYQLNVKKSICQQLTKLKTIIYGCHRNLIAREKDFSKFVIMRLTKEDDIDTLKLEFKKNYFINMEAKKTEPQTLKVFRQNFFKEMIDNCQIGNLNESVKASGNLHYFGFAYAHDNLPVDIDYNSNYQSFKVANPILNLADLSVQSLKGIKLFGIKKDGDNLNCFKTALTRLQLRLLIPFKRENQENSLVFVIYHSLVTKINETNKTKDIQTVYSLQDTNPSFLASEETFKRTETISTDVVNSKKEDGPEKEILARNQLSLESLFKPFKLYYLELWIRKPYEENDELMKLVDIDGNIEGLIDRGFIPYWPKTIPVRLKKEKSEDAKYNTADFEDVGLEREFKSIEKYIENLFNPPPKPKSKNEKVPPRDLKDSEINLLKYYKELPVSADFFFSFFYYSYRTMGMFNNHQIMFLYRIWIKFDFDLVPLEVEMECPT